MGNEAGKPTSPLGIAAIAATTTGIEREQITELCKKCYKAMSSTGHLSRSDLESCLASMTNFEQSDTELFDKIFIMFDAVGENEVECKPYISALCPLVSGIG